LKLINIFYRRNLLNTIIKIFIAILIGFISYLVSNELKIIFNQAILNNQLNVFSLHLIYSITLFVIMFLLNIISSVFDNFIRWRGAKNIITHSVKQLMKTDYSYFVKNSPPEIWTEMNMSAQQTAGFYSSFIELSSSLIEFFVYGAIIININIYAGLFSICVIPISFLLTFWMQKKLTTWRMNIMNASKNSSAVALETISSAKNIKAKNAYVYFGQKLEEAQSKLTKSFVVSSFYETYWISVTSLISSIAPLLVIYLLMRITNTATNKPGDIIVLYSFIPLFLFSFKSIYSIVLTYFSAHPFLQTSERYCQLEEERSGNHKIEHFERLETKGCYIKHNNGQIVNIPDISIQKGEKVLIIGESGIGKSTLFNILLGLTKGFSGSVTVNNIPMQEIDIHLFREKVGISFQGSGVFSQSLKENILLGEKGNFDFDRIISITQLRRQLKDKGEQVLNVNNLSGGEKARILLAQNLIRNPELILIDESLSSVDESMESEIISNIISELNNSTIICISHRESSKRYFDKVIKF